MNAPVSFYFLPVFVCSGEKGSKVTLTRFLVLVLSRRAVTYTSNHDGAERLTHSWRPFHECRFILGEWSPQPDVGVATKHILRHRKHATRCGPCALTSSDSGVLPAYVDVHNDISDNYRT